MNEKCILQWEEGGQVKTQEFESEAKAKAFFEEKESQWNRANIQAWHDRLRYRRGYI